MRRAALALQDIVLLVYLSTVAVLFLVRSPAGPGPVFFRLVGGTVFLAATAIVARRVTRIPRWVRLGAYRVIIVGAIVWSYLILQDVLPVVRPDTVDAALAAADARIFGTDPALWVERWNRPAIVEWLAFFYFNYYTLMLAFVIGVLWIQGPRSPTAVEFGLGTALLYAIGQLGYMVVPGFGPVVFFADRYHGPLQGGTFLRLVIDSVSSSGAQKDVFPSMHTGGSVWYALFAVHQAMLDRRWRVPAAASVFVAANIVVSTVVLRWHYVVDVMAGITLATLVVLAAARIAPWEEARRRRLGMPAVWSFE